MAPKFQQPLPSAKEDGGLYVPTLRKTGLDPDHYLLRLAETIRIDLAGSLRLHDFAIGSVESWVEEVRKFGLLEFLEDDQEDCLEDCQESSMESLEVAGRCREVMSGKFSLACMEYHNILIPLRMPGCQYRYGQG